MKTGDSNYVEKKDYHSRYTHERMPALRGTGGRLKGEPSDLKEWLDTLQAELPKFIPFLTRQCGIHFRGRVLEIGAGAAWLSAEISKLPNVVEVITTDISPRLLKEEAPRVFALLGAQTSKITRMPADFHALHFPEDHFDFVVCSGVLQHAANIVQVLREAKRVLKPGGKLVVIREPIWPLMKMPSRETRLAAIKAGEPGVYYTLSDFKEFFKSAALPVEAKKVSLSSGLKYYIESMVNGLTHARYVLIGTRPNRPAAPQGTASRRPGSKPRP